MASLLPKQGSLLRQQWGASVVLVGALLLAACAPAAPAAPQATGAGAENKPSKTYRIGMSAGKVANPSARQLYAGFTYRARQLGAEVKVNDANLDINKQVSDIDQFTSQKMDAVIFQLIGDPNAVKGPVERARQAGVHIFAFDPVPGVDGVELIALQPSARAGELSAEWIGKKLNGKGNIAIVGGPPIPVLKIRWETAKKVLAEKYPDIKVVEQQDAIPDDASGGRRVGENLLAKYKDIDVIWTVNDSIASGVGAAVRAAGRSVIVTGLNADEEGIQGIKEGTISVTWDMLGLDLGQKAADTALKIVSGETPRPTSTMTVTTEPVEYTKENAEQWIAPEKRIPYPALN